VNVSKVIEKDDLDMHPVKSNTTVHSKIREYFFFIEEKGLKGLKGAKEQRT
jgi:hypothetical protein